MDNKFTKKELLRLLENVSDDAIIMVNVRGVSLTVWAGGFTEADENEPEAVNLLV